ncbi:MAG: pyridoxamine 5'-phosphate oxidase [Flavobacteriaceae bacterium]|jgi:pyridoxamine 5'-phosphate oxidase|nr:pyridoxamine 5'-phosphate oxidase [Flavobacteriaceae bacterium]MBT4959826.1 pyridoxamine 5'-phosphate oxidase [Flavobacteriaceae bacterium]MDG1830108.1 pyridoxamine 5'-phosphate oxidase [Flavobacteriaceae bacterium]
MSKDLSRYRKEYLKGFLIEENLPENPIKLFSDWFNNADSKSNEIEPNAMSLSAIDLNGVPITRVVLLKKFSNDGFVFCTNYSSTKGKSITKNPNVCMSFFWSSLEQQVIINGKASKVSEADSDNYFNSRPIGSRLGAIISNQSEIIPSREYLENKLKKNNLENNSVKRPKNWGGYIVDPTSIEFWQGRENRLHDRILYKKENNIWNYVRLSP